MSALVLNSLQQRVQCVFCFYKKTTDGEHIEPNVCVSQLVGLKQGKSLSLVNCLVCLVTLKDWNMPTEISNRNISKCCYRCV